MKRIKLLIALLAISVFALGATPALAAPPSNDTVAGAKAITALPFSDTVDTTQATTDADELAAGQPCRDVGAPAIEKAVWYKYTASANVTLLVDTSASSGYTTGIAAYDGAPTAATFVACAPSRLTTSVASGRTAYLMVFGDQPGSAGGTLRITVQEAPPPPQVSLTIDPVGTFDPKGSATVSGTATCTGQADFANVNGTLVQTVGRFTISGFFFAPLTCDGVSHGWTAQLTSTNGRFGGGKATAQATAFACNSSGCGSASAMQQVRLRGK